MEQKFATDLNTITWGIHKRREVTKNTSLLRETDTGKVHDEYKEHHKHLSTRFGIVFYDDKIVIPQDYDER